MKWLRFLAGPRCDLKWTEVTLLFMGDGLKWFTTAEWYNGGYKFPTVSNSPALPHSDLFFTGAGLLPRRTGAFWLRWPQVPL